MKQWVIDSGGSMLASHQGVGNYGGVNRKDRSSLDEDHSQTGNDVAVQTDWTIRRMSESGQFLPPSSATAMEELASTPDAKARNRCAAF
jgi:hypothetical protein